MKIVTTKPKNLSIVVMATIFMGLFFLMRYIHTISPNIPKYALNLYRVERAFDEINVIVEKNKQISTRKSTHELISSAISESNLQIIEGYFSDSKRLSFPRGEYGYYELENINFTEREFPLIWCSSVEGRKARMYELDEVLYLSSNGFIKQIPRKDFFEKLKSINGLGRVRKLEIANSNARD